MGLLFPLREIHRILYQFRRSGEHYDLSSSVNKLSISRSKETLFHAARVYCVKCGGENKHGELLGPSSNDLSRMIKGKNRGEKCKWGFHYVWFYVPWSLLRRSPGPPGWQRNHPWLKRLTQEFTKIKVLDYLPSKTKKIPREQTENKKSPKHNLSFATRIHLYNQMF